MLDVKEAKIFSSDFFSHSNLQVVVGSNAQLMVYLLGTMADREIAFYKSFDDFKRTIESCESKKIRFFILMKLL